MYWQPKLHKTPIVPKFTVASKKGSSKTLSDVIYKVFITIFEQFIFTHPLKRFELLKIHFQLLQN